MTKPDMIDDFCDTQSDTVRMVKIGVASAIYLASLWLIIAVQNDVLKDMHQGWTLGLMLVAAIMVIIISTLWLSALDITSSSDEPVAPRTRRARNVLVWSCVLGAAISVIFYLWPGDDWASIDMMSNGPIPASLAIVLAVIYVVGMIYSCLGWAKNIDEHERASINAGLYGAFLIYGILAPAWWILERASLVPDQDPMIMYTLVLTLFAAIWTYKRGT